jgi:TRAP-type C4-dicarboxylate transport system permease small subunit
LHFAFFILQFEALLVIPMRIVKALDRALARCEGCLIVLFLWLMVVLAFFQVCLRGLYTHGRIQWANTLMGHLDWTEPLVRLLVLWLAFLGASLVTGEGRHIKIDLFSSLLSSRWQPLRDLVLWSVCVGICAIMFKVCAGYVALEMEFGAKMFLSIPGWIGQLILPAGFLLMLFRFSLKWIDSFLEITRGRRE